MVMSWTKKCVMYKPINRMSPSFLSVIVRHALHRKLCRVFRILGTVYDIYVPTHLNCRFRFLVRAGGSTTRPIPGEP